MQALFDFFHVGNVMWDISAETHCDWKTNGLEKLPKTIQKQKRA